MNLLAIETASGTPSLCLRRGAAASLLWRGEPRAGPELILVAAGTLLAEAALEFGDLDAIACGRGPGAFTGVRLAIALAQGLALGTGCRLLPVSDLAALAWRAHRVHGWTRVLTCIDARRAEVYWAAYLCADGIPRNIAEEAVSEPGEVVLPPGRWACAGSGAPLIAPERTLEADSGLAPDAEAVAALAAAMIAGGEEPTSNPIEPAYLRDRVAAPKR